jgi:preprotein translocase subunit SecD
MKMMTTIALLSSVLMAADARLPNGVYAVEEAQANAKTPVVRQYEGKDIVLDAATYAPLSIVGRPEVFRAGDQSGMMVQLRPESAKKLEDLTRSHMGRPIAVVVGDRVLSTPTVRSIIKDGRARITPCDDHNCENLVRQLSE